MSHCTLAWSIFFGNKICLTLKLPGPYVGMGGSLTVTVSLKPLCSGMGEVVPARTSPTLLPPSPRTELSLSCFKVSECINCRDWHCKICFVPHAANVKCNVIKPMKPRLYNPYPKITKLHIYQHNSYSASHGNWCTATLWNRIVTAQCEGMGEVGSARYEPALLPPCPSIRVLSYSNCQRSTHSRRRAWQFKW